MTFQIRGFEFTCFTGNNEANFLPSKYRVNAKSWNFLENGNVRISLIYILPPN